MTKDEDLEILNIVHALGVHVRNTNPAVSSERSPAATGNSFNGSSNGLDFHSNSKETPQAFNRIGNRIALKSSSNRGTPNSSRRIQPMSVPRKPPDIQNTELFPSLGESLGAADSGPNRRQSFPPEHFPGNNSGCALSPTERKLKKLESKFRGAELSSSDGTSNGFTINRLEVKVKPKRASITTISVSQSPTESSFTTKEGSRKVPRSAELFVELTPEVIQEVDKLAAQYSSILDNNICCNILEEFTLLLQLVASGKGGPSTGKLTPKLSSLAQQVYFVIKVLSLQLDSALISVDPLIIQLLVQKYPHRIPKPVRKHFDTWVEDQLRKKEEAHRVEMAKSPSLLSASNKPSQFHQCVTFHSETDGRANFPSQGDFHAFCKQRDLFYTIKNMWKEREAQGGTFVAQLQQPVGDFKTTGNRNNFNRMTSARDPDPLYSKIKALFHLNSSGANLSHLAALFTSQFVLDSMDGYTEIAPRGVDGKEGTWKNEEMRTIMESNPDRFAKLQDRMSMGYLNDASQADLLAFSRYFLGVASNPGFNQHLADRLTHEIHQVETSLDNSVDFYPDEMTALFRKTILTSQLLGYVTFLPYTNDGSWNKQGAAATVEKEALLSAQIRLRSHQIPPLNLESQLSIAIARRRLTFTLPWVLEFLLAADATSLQLPAYKRVTKLLVSIYRSYLKLYNKKKSISVDNLNFLRFWCGRFFSSEKVVKDILFQVEIPKLAGASERISFQEEEPLDHCDKIGKTLIELYFASKFTEMKSILHAGLEQQQQEPNEVAFLCTSINQSEPKHIRPIPAGPKKNSKQLKQIQLQIQLESSFFDSNPPSVKKTVEFIAERIASNYVKKLRAQMPQMRCDLASQDIFEVQASMDCKKRMFEGLEEFSKTRCNDTVNILIGELSVTPSALIICQEITFRKCTEKVSEWIDNHIKAEMFPVIPPEDVKVMQKKQQESVSEEKTAVNGQPLEPFEPTFSTMILLHRTLRKFHLRKPVADDHLDDILFSKSLETCSVSVATTLVDFGLALMAFSPERLTSSRQERLVSLWKKNWNPDYKILCPRNILMMQDSSTCTSSDGHQKSWKVLTELISRLMKEDLLSLETLEQDCFRLVREELSPSASSNISNLLKEILATSRKSTVRNDESREMIDWIAWYCSDQPDDDL